MIHFIVGKPRNGKTYYAFRLLVDRIIKSKTYIVTNLVIDLDALQIYLIKKHNITYRVHDRIRQITDAEMVDFWLVRKHGDILKAPDYDQSKGSMIDFSPLLGGEYGTLDEASGKWALNGTDYYIDECHVVWPSRGCMNKTSRHQDYYFSQHGKLGDTVYLITQNTKLVDQNLIRFAQDFTYCTNYRLQKHGHFRGANKFEARTYQSPVSAGDKAPTMEINEWTLDKEFADLYDTSAGVGIAGGTTADAGFRVKGFSLRWIWIMMALLLVVFFIAWNWGSEILVKKMFGPLTQPPAKPAPARPGQVPTAPVQGEPTSHDSTKTREQYVTGMHEGPGFALACLDGQWVHVDTVNMRAGYVTIDGQRFYLKPSKCVPHGTQEAFASK